LNSLARVGARDRKKTIRTRKQTEAYLTVIPVTSTSV
jgi:hypothetical protein